MTAAREDKSQPREITVKQEEPPIELEVLASAIVAISEGVKKMRAARINERCLLLLIQHACPKPTKYGSPVSIATVKAVLEGMGSLERVYLKPKVKK